MPVFRYVKAGIFVQREQGMRRVVITGIGAVTPMGDGADHSWSQILAGKSGAGPIESFEVEDLACKIACQIPRGDGSNGTFFPDNYMSPKEQRKVDDFILFGLAAANQALNDANWHPETHEDQCATGVMIGSGVGGLEGIGAGEITVKDRGPRRLSPFFIPGRLINLISGYVSIEHGLKGPNHSVVTACSTGAHAIGDASRMVALGDADVMVAGGAESAVCRLGIAGFVACRALSTGFNDDPTSASRPYDKDRDGFVMGEGAGVVVLEELEHALARGANIYAEVIGYGMSGDAYHITAPSEDGDGAFRCMQAAMKRAGIAPEEIDYINAHGTSTPMGDEIELRAVERLVGSGAETLTMSSTKSATGHLLGAAGAIEAIFTALSIRDQVAPPTLNLHNPSADTKIDLVPLAKKEKSINVALSNSFGFGGTNASLVMKKYDG